MEKPENPMAATPGLAWLSSRKKSALQSDVPPSAITPAKLIPDSAARVDVSTTPPKEGVSETAASPPRPRSTQRDEAAITRPVAVNCASGGTPTSAAAPAIREPTNAPRLQKPWNRLISGRPYVC